MKTQFQTVLNNFRFLSPTYTGQLYIVFNYMLDNNITYEVNHLYQPIANMATKNIHLMQYMFPENYIESDFENQLLNDFYKLINTNATKIDLATLNISNLENLTSAVTKIRLQLINLLVESRYNELNYIIVTPTMLKYISNMDEFRITEHFMSLNGPTYNRLTRIGKIFGNIDVYLDYIEDDFIVVGSTQSDPLKLFYSWNNCAPNQIHYSLESVCYDFSNKFYIIKQFSDNDPMEIDITSVSADQFFN